MTSPCPYFTHLQDFDLSTEPWSCSDGKSYHSRRMHQVDNLLVWMKPEEVEEFRKPPSLFFALVKISDNVVVVRVPFRFVMNIIRFIQDPPDFVDSMRGFLTSWVGERGSHHT